MPEAATVYLYDYDYRAIASSDHLLIGQSLASTIRLNIPLNSLSTNTEELLCNDKKVLFKLTSIPFTDWTLLLLIPSSALTLELFAVFKNGFIICIIVLSIILGAASIFVKENLLETKRIVTGLQQVEGPASDFRLPPSRIGEFNLIVQGINEMLSHLERATLEALKAKEHMYTSELLKKDAQLYALQTQINPHFLYNTLGCISGIARNYEINEIVTISDAMARIFRYCIKKNDSVTLAEELDCVQEYLSIIQLRFPHRMQFFIDPSEKYADYQIPKMILQPLVENAIQHGLRHINKVGILHISFKESNENFVINIQDNGVGINQNDLIQLKEKMSMHNFTNIHDDNCIGLLNINTRLRLIFGEEYGLTVKSEPGKGTSVYLHLPQKSL